ncbi:MAG: uracil-DNA glycosylase family protein [Lentisphaeria bacterium]|nr:uracil-DNA glycosylase family protein [Candidatus Neomarinimicrobiota bacterium]MCF7843168.1 uracil-DNA glycosylase family protein [Lentisphaeria bacterium]
MEKDTAFQKFIQDVEQCRLCAGEIPEPRPVFRFQPTATILVVGQAPGRKVHETGIPWNDASGKLLRDWMGISSADFYDERRIAILPSAFCFPGTDPGKGDRPPPRICFETWHHRFMAWFEPKLILAIGRYAIQNYLGISDPVGHVVADWQTHWKAKAIFPLPHPSPRNRKWLRDRPWFEIKVIPALREIIQQHITP